MEPYELLMDAGARRCLQRLPSRVAAAVAAFVVGPLLENPHRVGKPLRMELAGLHSARVGAYRVVYAIRDDERVVEVIVIDHRADVYRPR